MTHARANARMPYAETKHEAEILGVDRHATLILHGCSMLSAEKLNLFAVSNIDPSNFGILTNIT
jgi:hypothetical protein